MLKSIRNISGQALDYLVAESLGLTKGDSRIHISEYGNVGRNIWRGGDYNGWNSWETFCPSANWSIGGPLIDAHISALGSDDNSPTKYAWHKDGKARASGKHFLEAAMRCIVIHLTGKSDEWHTDLQYEVPDQLCQ